ncbi:MAG: HD domain-containing protein [Proteobacteria bacterium]|nr:HD domain-containing protein [Pseudomonadota bacterium]
MVTAVDDPEIAETALETGIYGYIIKPFNPNEVIINIRNSLRRRELEIADRAYRGNLKQEVEERTAELRKTLRGVIYALTMTVEYRDPYTAGHQQRVSDLSRAMAKEMGFSKDKIMGIRMAGVLHDIGKIAIPAEILSKPGRLSKTEFELIKNHSQVGYDILKSIQFPWPLSQIVLQHHERMDGSGYPNGLLGKEMLIESSILGIADVVEAMASHRPYRAALGIDKALEEISINKGKFYDVEVVNACLKVFKDKKFKFKV